MKKLLPLCFTALVLIGCASTRTPDYVKPELSESTIDEINQTLENRNPERAVELMFALGNNGIHIDQSVLKKLQEKAAAELQAQFKNFYEKEQFKSALEKFHSLEQLGLQPENGIKEYQLYLAWAKQSIEDGKAVSGLTVLQRVLNAPEVTADDLSYFADAAVASGNTAICRRIVARLQDLGTEIPEKYTAFLNKKGTFADMISGTVTIWVDRGIRLEGGVGYPDRAIGSGFFIDKQGYLLTNYHVIKSEVDPEYEGYSRLYIKLSADKDTKIPAKVVGYDRVFDIALLKAEVTPPYVFSFSNESDFLAGERIYAIGSPVGLENTLTSGIVSATGRRFLQMGDTLQVDVPVNAGNSGGPLLNEDGKLVGVIFAGLEQYEGLNFAIPAHWVNMILPALYEGGEVKHPWLGAAVSDSDSSIEVMYSLPGEAAGNAGLQQGDIIETINGKSYAHVIDLQHDILQLSKDDLVKIQWKRGKKEYTGYFSLGERPYQPMDLALKRDRRDNLVTPLFGMTLEKTDTVFWNPNYIVKKVYPGTIADETGLSPEDPVSIQKWVVDEKNKVVYMQLYMMKRKAGFLEKAVQLAAYLEVDNFI